MILEVLQAHERNPELEQFVEAQAVLIKSYVKDLSLQGIRVSTQPERRDAHSFDARRTFALSGIHELPIAIAAGSGTKKIDPSPFPISTLIIAPTHEGSGILVDDATGALYTDSFWVCENNTFRYIKPSAPIPIDVLDVHNDHDRKDTTLEEYRRIKQAFHDLTDDKVRTKDVLTARGIRVPHGISKRYGDPDILEQFDIFHSQQQTGVVLKANNGAHGEGVNIFESTDQESIDNMKELIFYTSEDDADQFFLLEERIVPPHLPQLQALIPEKEQEKGVDYNFRVIVSLDRDNPRVIDSEVRFRANENSPVNISIDAQASRLDVLEDNELVAKIHDTAADATRAICEEVLSPGQKTAGVAGVDVMIDQSYEPVVIEVNAGSPVGGFGTLTRLDKKPLQSIHDNYLPGLMPQLEQRFLQRQKPSIGNLRMLPHNVSDFDTLRSMYLLTKQYERFEHVVMEMAPELQNDDQTMRDLIFTGARLGRFDVALEYIEKKLMETPDNATLWRYKVRTLRHMGRNDEAQELLDRLMQGKNDKIDNFLAYEQECLYLKAGEEEKAIESMLRTFPFSQHAIAKLMASTYRGIGMKQKARNWQRKAARLERRNSAWKVSFEEFSLHYKKELTTS